MPGGVLAVFAHPDDESLLAGGVLAACAAAGRRVSIVSLTRGERGPNNLPGRPPLGEVRAGEFQAAATALGATTAECLEYPDGELSTAGDASDALSAILQRERPEVVISFSEEGLYWHPDHLAVVSFLNAALESARRVWRYGATWPEGHAAKLVALMRSRGLADDLWGIEPEAFGAEPGTELVSIDVRPFLEAKLAALRCYESQIAPSHLLGALPEDLAEEFLGREYFVRVAAGGPQPDLLAELLSR